MAQDKDNTLEMVDVKKKVRIETEDGYMNLLVMKNGWQWSGAPVDHEILMMLKELIRKYEDREASK